MGSRPGFIIDHFVEADGGQPPNQYAACISVQMRCHWPPRAPKSQVRTALVDCFLKAIEELDSKCDYSYRVGNYCRNCDNGDLPFSHWIKVD